MEFGIAIDRRASFNRCVMSDEPIVITSLQNDRVKEVVKLRKRSHRDEMGQMIIEGYRGLLRALDNGWNPTALFVCRDLFLGENEETLIDRCRAVGAEIFDCTAPVFRKMAYRDRPEGLLALAPQVQRTLDDLNLPDNPLLLVAESIEKPGNVGTMLRTADAAGVDAVIVCDKCTDINNPNVVRASVGTLFTVPVVEASSDETMQWLRSKGIQIVAATPAGEKAYCEVDLSKPSAVVVGSEQYGLHQQWLDGADLKVVIPMRGQCDSLNVASAATILLYEALRQRR